MNPLRRLLAPVVDGFRRIEDGQQFASLDHDDDLMAVADAVQDEPVAYGLTALARAVRAEARADADSFAFFESQFEPDPERYR